MTSFGGDERKKGVGLATYTHTEVALAVWNHISDAVRTTQPSAVYTQIFSNAKSVILEFDGGESVLKRDTGKELVFSVIMLLGHALLVHIVWRNMDHVKHADPT